MHGFQLIVMQKLPMTGFELEFNAIPPVFNTCRKLLEGVGRGIHTSFDLSKGLTKIPRCKKNQELAESLDLHGIFNIVVAPGSVEIVK